MLNDSAAFERDSILTQANEAGMGFRPPWESLDQVTYLGDAPRMPTMLIAEFARKLINIPSSPKLCFDSVK